ncbi:MAG: ABC transporter ATP-binding protein [Symploca sp. SIO3C6]|uniref:ABC transporter ATP-binding protein n=1 Tax=Symploca sp. SIO1C4 TaxID=2607765 RepID=A0A6B3N0U6_9CYAN|nr:ABC transporter ATP-binding protein [Symploca sp. SIO3C6]NER27286.1 ABC transporter ATP-binding protein [Symploca sp. SIO1C4]NET05486.1 ABC transporter ATP-binding protein [Symploca sp. SIO2B6]
MSSNRLLLQYAVKYRSLIVLTVILGFSGALFNGVGTALIVPVLLGFLGKEFNLEGGPPLLQKFLSIFDRFDGEARLPVMLGAILLTIILKNLATYASGLSSGYLSRALVNGMRLKGLRMLLDVDLDFYSKHKIGDIMSRINHEIGRTAGAIKIGVKMFTQSATILVFVAILLQISWQLTLITTVLLLMAALGNQYFVKRAKVFGKILTAKSRAFSNGLIEILTGIRLIKTVGEEEKTYQKMRQIIREREKSDFQAQANFAAIGPINEISGILAVLAIILAGRYVFNDTEKLESFAELLVVYLVVLFRLLPFVSQLNGSRSQFANASASVEVVHDFLQRDKQPIMVNGSIPYQGLEKGIRFEGVNFSYPGSDRLALSGVDLWLPKGTTLALVGTSGAGKSTLADLIPRFYDVAGGRILLDDKDLREYDIKSVRRAMGVVSQDTFLFNNSVFYNLAYGWKNATEEEVITAAKRANAYEFILQLANGFETQIGDRGVMLSGGQRQRLAIARALLRNPDLLILDEATSALDTVSERLVQQAIDELCRDRTTVVIAHRLSTVQNADQIAVMDKGRVVEVGTHEELLAKKGSYTRLYEMQFSKKADDVTQTAVNKALMESSYEIRTRLNPMIGFLQLVVDDLVDSEDERQELTEEAYQSAIRLLNTLEFFEESSK